MKNLINCKFPNYHFFDNGLISKKSKADNIDIESLEFLTPYTNGKGYYQVKLVNNEGKQEAIYVHQIIVRTFIGSPPADGKQYDIHHKDLNPANNTLENLMYIEHTAHLTLHRILNLSKQLSTLYFDTDCLPSGIYSADNILQHLMMPNYLA